MRAYLMNTSVELEIKSFYNQYNECNTPCLMCRCYVAAYDSIEDIPAARIEIK